MIILIFYYLIVYCQGLSRNRNQLWGNEKIIHYFEQNIGLNLISLSYNKVNSENVKKTIFQYLFVKFYHLFNYNLLLQYYSSNSKFTHIFIYRQQVPTYQSTPIFLNNREKSIISKLIIYNNHNIMIFFRNLLM